MLNYNYKDEFLRTARIIRNDKTLSLKDVLNSVSLRERIERKLDLLKKLAECK